MTFDVNRNADPLALSLLICLELQAEIDCLKFVSVVGTADPWTYPTSIEDPIDFKPRSKNEDSVLRNAGANPVGHGRLGIPRLEHEL